MLYYRRMIFYQFSSIYRIRFAKIPLSKTCFTSLKLKLDACMNASLSESRLPMIAKTK
jgi:hypothetical protein